MPNYCDGYLAIDCSENVFEEIRNFVSSEDSVFDFHKIIPMPDYIYKGLVGSEEREKYGENNWYDWCNKNWGTKWNACDAELSGKDYRFQTAWSPCSPVIAALAKRFPEATMRYTYVEPGMCFCGVEEYHDGKMVYCLTGSNYCEHWPDDSDDDGQDIQSIIEDVVPSDMISRLAQTGYAEKFTLEDKMGNVTRGHLLLYANEITYIREINASVEFVDNPPEYWF